MLEPPEKIRELQRKLYQKAKQDYTRYRQLHRGLNLRKPLEEDDWKAVFEKIERRV